MKLYILDSAEVLLSVVPISLNTAGEHIPVFDARHRKQIQGEDALELQVSADHPDNVHIKEGNKIAYQNPDNEEEWFMFNIMKVTDTHEYSLTKKVYAENIFYDLLYDPIEDIRPRDARPRDMIESILRDTIWQVGIVDSSIIDLLGANFYYTNALDCLRRVEKLYNGELYFRLTYDETSKRFTRYVDFYREVGTDIGKQFRFGKDIENVEREVNMFELYTAMYGRGKGEASGDGYGAKLTFKDIEWKIANGDPTDKPLGQEWVGSLHALQNFGRQGGTIHRTGFFEDSEETDAQALLEKTWEYLQAFTKPKTTYRLSVIDLFRASDFDILHSHERVDLGDYVVVIDEKFAVPFRDKVRVMEIEQDLIRPQNTKIVLGNHLEDGLSSQSTPMNTGELPNVPRKEDATVNLALEYSTIELQAHGIQPTIQGRTFSPPEAYDWRILVFTNGNDVAPLTNTLLSAGHVVETLADADLNTKDAKWLAGFNLVILTTNCPNAVAYQGFEAPMIVHHYYNAYQLGIASNYRPDTSITQMAGALGYYDSDRYDIFDGLLSADGTDKLIMSGDGVTSHLILPTEHISIKVAGVKNFNDGYALMTIPDKSKSDHPDIAFFGLVSTMTSYYSDVWRVYLNLVEYMIQYHKKQPVYTLPDENIFVGNVMTVTMNTLQPEILAIDETRAPEPPYIPNVLVVYNEDEVNAGNHTYLSSLLSEMGWNHHVVEDKLLYQYADSYLAGFSIVIIANKTNNAQLRNYHPMTTYIVHDGSIATSTYKLGEYSTIYKYNYTLTAMSTEHEIFKYKVSNSLVSSGEINTVHIYNQPVTGFMQVKVTVGNPSGDYMHALVKNKATRSFFFGAEDFSKVTTDGKLIYKGILEHMHMDSKDLEVKVDTMDAIATGSAAAPAITFQNADINIKPPVVTATATKNTPVVSATRKSTGKALIITNDYTLSNDDRTMVTNILTSAGWTYQAVTLGALDTVSNDAIQSCDIAILLSNMQEFDADRDKIISTNIANRLPMIIHDFDVATQAPFNIGSNVERIPRNERILYPLKANHPIFDYTYNPSQASYTVVGGTSGTAPIKEIYTNTSPANIIGLATHINDQESAAIIYDTNKKHAYFGVTNLQLLTKDGQDIYLGLVTFVKNNTSPKEEIGDKRIMIVRGDASDVNGNAASLKTMIESWGWQATVYDASFITQLSTSILDTYQVIVLAHSNTTSVLDWLGSYSIPIVATLYSLGTHPRIDLRTNASVWSATRDKASYWIPPEQIGHPIFKFTENPTAEVQLFHDGTSGNTLHEFSIRYEDNTFGNREKVASINTNFYYKTDHVTSIGINAEKRAILLSTTSLSQLTDNGKNIMKGIISYAVTL